MKYMLMICGDESSMPPMAAVGGLAGCDGWSVNASLKVELVHRTVYPTLRHARKIFRVDRASP